MEMIKEFKEFAMKGNVIDLAVGIINGGAFGKIVSSLVNDVIMPPIGMALGRLDFSNLFKSPWDVVIGAVVLIGFLTVNCLFLVWAERKLSARMQRRLGPTERGPAGILQTVVDMGKLLGKETITPKHVHKPLYTLAPILIFAPIVAVASLFPISRGFVVNDIDLGLLLVFAFSGMVII